MKVLMICTEKLPVPPIHGGAIQTYIYETAMRLADRHQITVLCGQDPQLPDQQELRGVSYVRVPRGHGTLPEYASAVSHYLRQNRFDLIHIFNRPRLVMPVRSAAPESRIVLSLHNDMFELAKIRPEEAEKALQEIETIITVSNYVGQRVAALYPQAAEKLMTIYSGVDLQSFAPGWSEQAAKARKSLRATHRLGKGPVILFVGRLSPKKGADVLLQAMAAISRKYPGAALVLVGSKWYGEDRVTDYVAYVRALGARSAVKVVSTGFVAPPDIPSWFWAGDVFVCASQWQEPLARVHFEAMAAGLPIITTDRGGNAEVVRGLDNGIVIDNPGDPSSFANALIKLLGNSALREQMGRNGRALAEARFGWGRVVSEILSVWEGRPSAQSHDQAPSQSAAQSQNEAQ